MKKTQYLFCPGPVHVALNVKIASQVDMCHREEEFSKLLGNLNNNILDLFEIKNKEKYYPVVITGSSTAANESVLSSIVDLKPILILSNGEFGDRLNNISRIHNPNTHFLDFGWGKKMDLESIEEYVKEHNIKVVAIAHHETSTGMINPIKKIGAIAHKYGALFFVDAVSSIGADHIDIEGSHVNFCTTSSGKALASYPGTSIILGKIDDFEKLKDVTPKTMYLHVYKFYRFSKDLLQTPNTPNISGFLALNQAITNIIEEGVSNRIKRINSYATMIRQALQGLGLEFIVEDENLMSNMLTTVKVPATITPTELQEKLREKNIIIYSGKGPLKDIAFQVSNIGEIEVKDIKYLIEVFKEIFDEPKQVDFSRSERINHFVYTQNKL